MSIFIKALDNANFCKNAVAGLVCALVLTACDDSGNFDLQSVFAPKPDAEPVAAAAAETKFTEKDVEAPEVFSATEAGLWDGRPSLGGVWVAHPDVTQPERVIIRNNANGQFVVGALFRRERDIPGPRLQISSDAAQAIGVLAGAPIELNVTALRKEQVPVAPEVSEDAVEAIEAPAEISESSLDPIAAAGAAIEAADPTPVTPATTTAAAAPTIQSTLPVSTLKKPFVQVGIFSMEKNAERVATQIRSAGMEASVRQQEANGKAFWRVLAGPATNPSEQRKLIDQVRGEGFSDAYAVSN